MLVVLNTVHHINICCVLCGWASNNVSFFNMLTLVLASPTEIIHVAF